MSSNLTPGTLIFPPRVAILLAMIEIYKPSELGPALELEKGEKVTEVIPIKGSFEAITATDGAHSEPSPVRRVTPYTVLRYEDEFEPKLLGSQRIRREVFVLDGPGNRAISVILKKFLPFKGTLLGIALRRVLPYRHLSNT